MYRDEAYVHLQDIRPPFSSSDHERLNTPSSLGNCSIRRSFYHMISLSSFFPLLPCIYLSNKEDDKPHHKCSLLLSYSNAVQIIAKILVSSPGNTLKALAYGQPSSKQHQADDGIDNDDDLHMAHPQ